MAAEAFRADHDGAAPRRRGQEYRHAAFRQRGCDGGVEQGPEKGTVILHG
jgi:hypothetical protein